MPTLSRPSEAARAVYGHLAAHAFGFPDEEAAEWFARAGHDNLRVAAQNGRVVGGLVTIPMGQWFGGRAVPMAGVAGVAVAPEARGGGVATAMMRSFLRETRDAGLPLSALYPASVPLYRGVGYERAGHRFQITVAPVMAMTSERGLSVSTSTVVDDAELFSVYERFAAPRAGYLRRGSYVWRRILEPRKSTAEVFKVHGPSGIEGYVVIAHKRIEGPALETEVVATDVAALTRRAADRILRLLAEYGSVARQIRWFGGAADLMTFALRDRRHEIAVTDSWMLRLVDVPAALSLRGYPAHLDLSLDLEVDDPDLPENGGRHRLVVRDGRAVVERGGEGSLRAHVRALATLYSGHLPARTLAAAGLLSGDDATLLRAEAIFAGPPPAMPDFF